MRTILALLLAVIATEALAQAPSKNDDSCDISTQPAATLLLPYFEVDIASPPERARTTLFTIVNTTQIPQIARVTVWSDWAYPVVTFNLFLTGYDVQAINLHDVFVGGVIAPPQGTSNANTPGSRSLSNLTGNSNFLSLAPFHCSRGLPGSVPRTVLEDLQFALTTGVYGFCGRNRIGSTHTNAIGYVTVDVVATCGLLTPADAQYYADEILFDNVLTGDYQILDPIASISRGGPMVHIRAVPEGGAVGSRATTLPYTFYDRYTGSARTRDRRQPLPSVFAARYIQGAEFVADFQIWREGFTGAAAACSSYERNGSIGVVELVRFDERENPFLFPPPFVGPPGSRSHVTYLPATSMVRAWDQSTFPPLTSADVGGWIYMNLDYDPTTPPPVDRARRASQNWVRISMSSHDGRYDVDFDAAALGNGCSPAAAAPAKPIGPRP